MHHVPVKDDILFNFNLNVRDWNYKSDLLFHSSHGVSRKIAKPGYERGAERFQGQPSS